MAFAAWFGLLATALNLFTVAQLDGGHVTYAVLGRRSLWITLGTTLASIGLTLVSSSWIAWTVMLLVMLAVVGPRHPPTQDDETPLDPPRLWLALFALAMLVVCFTPAPIEPFVTGP
jgi:membrane-associated protease RseP (regulator of RpoE activity)